MPAKGILLALMSAVLVSGLAAPAAAQICMGPYGPVRCDSSFDRGPYGGGGYQRRPVYPPYGQPGYLSPAPQPYPYQGEYQGQGPYGSADPPGYEPELVARIQAGLEYLGYQPGPVDGVFGSRTHQAIREFQEDAGLPVDGLPSDQFYASVEQYLTTEQ